MFIERPIYRPICVRRILARYKGRIVGLTLLQASWSLACWLMIRERCSLNKALVNSRKKKVTNGSKKAHPPCQGMGAPRRPHLLFGDLAMSESRWPGGEDDEDNDLRRVR